MTRTRITTIEAHTAGEPLRVITSGYPEPQGRTMLERRAFAREHLDPLRRLLMREPRGHADMYGAVLTPPASPDGDVGVLFLHNEGYSTMCGHGILAIVKVGLEHGLFAADLDDIRIDTPAGRVRARATRRGGEITTVTFVNVPSFVLGDFAVDVPEVGGVTGTIAYGGAFYAFVDAGPLGLVLAPAAASELVRVGRAIQRAVADTVPIVHPEGDPALGYLYGTIFVAPQPGAHSRHVCIFADGQVDRSPTGTGVSARAAMLRARGALGDAWIRIDSILGTSFDVRVAGEAEVAGIAAVLPEVRGRAHVTGRAEFWLDPQDPLPDGFLLR